MAEGDRLLHVPSMKIEVQGTAGAGDAFASTLSLALAKGARAEVALQEGAINAAAAVSVADTQGGLLNRAQLDDRLQNDAATLAPRSWRWRADS